MLSSNLPTGMILSGTALHGRGLVAAGRIAGAMGTALLAPFSFTRMERGTGRAIVERIPYVVQQAVEQLSKFRQLILVGAPPPVSFFAYPGGKAELAPPECQIFTLAQSGEDCAGGVEALVAALSLGDAPPLLQKPEHPALPVGELSLAGLAAVVGALLPTNAIVVDESITSGRSMMAFTKGGPPHDWMVNTGGSIGIAMPLAIGAAVACPHRPVLCLSADGSGMYTLQALWTMARENLNITIIIFANRAYAILLQEYANMRVGSPGRQALDMMELARPDLDWVSLAAGMGVVGTRITTLDAFAEALRAGLKNQGPCLLEVVLH
jgi:acetolactate synthase-1/2/3 large subunit